MQWCLVGHGRTGRAFALLRVWFCNQNHAVWCRNAAFMCCRNILRWRWRLCVDSNGTVLCRPWTNRTYVCIHVCDWNWRYCSMGYEVSISSSCPVQMHYNGNTNLRWSSLNVWNRVVLDLHDQHVCLYCCDIFEFQSKVIIRCSTQYKVFFSSSCAVQNTLQWQWRQYDLRWMYGTAVSWLLALHNQHVRQFALYCCVFKLVVFDAIQYV